MKPFLFAFRNVFMEKSVVFSHFLTHFRSSPLAPASAKLTPAVLKVLEFLLLLLNPFPFVLLLCSSHCCSLRLHMLLHQNVFLTVRLACRKRSYMVWKIVPHKKSLVKSPLSDFRCLRVVSSSTKDKIPRLKYK